MAVIDTFTQTMSSHWLTTGRGRLGFASGPWLFYATGGYAIAGVKYSDLGVFPASASINAASSSETRVGWTAGGGAEYMLTPQWSVRAEYLYVDLGSTTYTSTNSVIAGATITHQHSLTENIARVGLDYKFGP